MGKSADDLPQQKNDDPSLNKGSAKKYTQQVFHPSLLKFGNTLSSTKPPNTSEEALSAPVCSEDEERTSEDSHIGWQKVPILRTNKRLRTSDSPPSPSISNTNRFKNLNIDASGDEEHPKRENKPPPLILYGVEDVCELTKTVGQVLKSNEYTIKLITKNQLRVSTPTPDAYKKLMSLVREKGLIGHTFTPKQERCCRIVIRNLHHTTPHEAIIEAIESTGNTIKGEIINARSGPNKNPTSTFFVNIEPSNRNKDVKSIKYIFNTAVIIEDPKKRRTIVQCTKCQQYGHTKNNCFRPYRCVKCAGSHNTSDCQKKDRNTPAKCALCLENHPANYKGCAVYQEILARRTKIGRPFGNRETHSNDQHLQSNNEKKPEKPKGQQKLMNQENTPSYSEILKGTHRQAENSEESNELLDLLIIQTKKMDILLQQISSLVGLMTTLVSKLIK